MPLSPAIQDYVDRQIITLHQANTLTYDQRTALESQPIRELIADGTITVDQALHFGYDQRTALESQPIRELIADGTITVDQALHFGYDQRKALESQPIRELIADGTITVDQALHFGYDQRKALESQPIRELIADGTITVDQALHFGYDQRTALESQPIRELIADGTITVDQALHFGYDQRTALEDAETRHRLRDGDLTIDDIMGGPVHHLAHGAAVVVPNINDGQSTHNASVHQAVSESATRLADRYQLKLIIDGAGLESVISSMVQFYVGSLSDDSQKNKAAKRCVLRITAPDYTFTDHSSQITTRQLLALTFLAICDPGNRVGSLEDARAQFIEGLYEIQRGYNLSDTGVDQGGQDRSICSAGTFNKLIEKLQGIHPDCQIRFITRGTASLKLPIVVREEAMRYMKSLSNPNTAEDLRAFTRLIAQVKEDGVEVIWDQIKDNVADRMFDEFGSLYRDRADHAFTGLIDAGQYTELPDLSILQEQVQNSKGYHQYCSQMLRQSGMFFTHKTSAEYLSAHRHDSQEAQRKYDQQFGLVLRK